MKYIGFLLVLLWPCFSQAEILLLNAPVYEANSKGEVYATGSKIGNYHKVRVLAHVGDDYRIVEGDILPILVHKNSLMPDKHPVAKIYGTVDAYAKSKSIKVGYRDADVARGACGRKITFQESSWSVSFRKRRNLKRCKS